MSDVPAGAAPGTNPAEAWTADVPADAMAAARRAFPAAAPHALRAALRAAAPHLVVNERREMAKHVTSRLGHFHGQYEYVAKDSLLAWLELRDAGSSDG